eukprot:CAMPEP_0184679050 /NCGR_PEP_ID=MMETSP0312-20130426/1880_1 /TAXON_ID=31354 /ORGANISM="Compsopogon coeruleus, Strain SAG 36.94" /LENGTH=131 /DNA_ID=CAMNT_0027128245 /DNA_START=56 /DNA_END=452 /DNA_ORIENTATION=-
MARGTITILVLLVAAAALALAQKPDLPDARNHPSAPPTSAFGAAAVALPAGWQADVRPSRIAGLVPLVQTVYLALASKESAEPYVARDANALHHIRQLTPTPLGRYVTIVTLEPTATEEYAVMDSAVLSGS